MLAGQCFDYHFHRSGAASKLSLLTSPHEYLLGVPLIQKASENPCGTIRLGTRRSYNVRWTLGGNQPHPRL